ncbi:MAG: hypothetical protein OHK0029_21150 [Armatimonadaceae bacterium]
MKDRKRTLLSAAAWVLFVGVVGFLGYGLLAPAPVPGEKVNFEIPERSATRIYKDHLFVAFSEPEKVILRCISLATGTTEWEFVLSREYQAVYFMGFDGDEAVFATEKLTCDKDSVLPCGGQNYSNLIFGPYTDSVGSGNWPNVAGAGWDSYTYLIRGAMPPLTAEEKRSPWQMETRDANLTFHRVQLDYGSGDKPKVTRTEVRLPEIAYRIEWVGGISENKQKAALPPSFSITMATSTGCAPRDRRSLSSEN